MTRRILHLDLDAFFCAVEEQCDRTLIGQSFAVGGSPKERGVVASCSYAARRKGVRSAMPMARAISLCPDLRIVPPNHKAYSQVSSQVMALLRSLTTSVEQISIDEAFLDISDIAGSATSIARQLQKRIFSELNLPCSIGIASNKLVAKTANNIGKASAQGVGPPNAITLVPPGEETSFLAPLPVEALWGVGPKTAQSLEEININTIGDLAGYPQEKLVQKFGKTGYDLKLRAQGIDDRPIVTYHEPKSFSNETTFARDILDKSVLDRTIRKLAYRVAKRIRQSNRVGITIKLKIRWPDFTTITRQITLSSPTDADEDVYHAARQLFNNVWKEGQAVRLIGVGISNLKSSSKQLSLWDYNPEPMENQKLEAAIKLLQERYGEQILQIGSKNGINKSENSIPK